MNYPSLVSLREVAPRDGWQKFKTVLPTEVKRELICSMIDYGARELEIGVFSSDPVRGRQYQDLDSLCQMVLPYAAEKGVRVTALVESVGGRPTGQYAGPSPRGLLPLRQRHLRPGLRLHAGGGLRHP